MNKFEQHNDAVLRHHFDEHDHYDDDNDGETLKHKREVKRMLEARLERKRLKDELEDFEGELDGDFDWDIYER